jgi:PKD repeat protein
MRRIYIIVIAGLMLIISCAPILMAEWSSDPNENTPIAQMGGEQVLPKIAVDNNGFSYISWFSNEAGNYNVRLQRLDPDGNMLWSQNGILVSSQPQESWLTDYDLTVDPSGYAVVTFTDIRTGQSNPVGYRISPDGDEMWGANGVLLADDSNFDPSPKVCTTTQGNSVFAWESCPDTGDYLVKLQKISPDGDPLWGSGITLSQAGVDLTIPYVQPADGDNVYLIWHTETGPYWAPNRGLYVQKLDANGTFMWATNTEIYAPVAEGPVVYLQMCRDDAGGIVFAWYRSTDISHFYCYVQHMDADGAVTMPANGVQTSTSSQRIHMYPAPAFLPQTQEIVVYFSEQDSNQNMRGIYAQKLDLQGNRLWGDEGKELIGLSNNDYFLFSASGKDNKAICTYQAAIYGSMAANIQAVMLDDQGNFVWTEHFIDLCSVQSVKQHNVMSDYYMGQWVAVYEDQRNDAGDIYAQNIQEDGTLGVVVNQPPIADFSWTPAYPTTQTVIQFNDLSHDPIGFVVNWSWSFGDGATSFMQNPVHQYTTAGTYTVQLTVTDNDGASNSTSKQVLVNSPPGAPTITGETSGKAGKKYTYTFTAVDPDGNDVSYYIDWGDNSTSGWIGPYSSGDPVNQSHTWTTKGSYTIKAKAKDSHGNESEWGTLLVSMPLSYEQPQFRFVAWLFERFPHAFPLLRHLLGW